MKRIAIVLEVEGDDEEEAFDVVDAALDVGTIQDAILEMMRDKDLDFEITSAVSESTKVSDGAKTMEAAAAIADEQGWKLEEIALQFLVHEATEETVAGFVEWYREVQARENRG